MDMLMYQYLPHRAYCQADVCRHHSVGSALEEVAPTHPFGGHTAAGCCEGGGRHPCLQRPEPDHLLEDTEFHDLNISG